MQFREIKQGYQVYILDTNKISATNGKVVNVSQPYFPSPQTFGQTQQAFSQTSTQRMIDVTIENDGRTQTLSVPENSQVVNTPNNMIISCDKEGIIREVEAIKAIKEERLKNRDKDEADLKSCEEILTSWNPEFAAKKEQDKRLSAMEDKIGNMEEMMKKFFQSYNKEK